MAMAEELKERLARLEGGYEHLATKADLAQLENRLGQMEGRIMWRTATMVILANGATVAAIVGLLQVIE